MDIKAVPLIENREQKKKTPTTFSRARGNLELTQMPVATARKGQGRGSVIVFWPTEEEEGTEVQPKGAQSSEF